MKLKNSDDSYGLVSKGLHWSMALLMIALIALGWWMVDMSYYDRWYHAALVSHRSLGMLLLLLLTVKVLWRILSIMPTLPTTVAPIERIASYVVHRCLMAVMLLLPVSGYLVSSSAGSPVVLWFDIQLPVLFVVTEQQRDWMISGHWYLAYATLLLIALHIIAALIHHFYHRDNLLRRML